MIPSFRRRLTTFRRWLGHWPTIFRRTLGRWLVQHEVQTLHGQLLVIGAEVQARLDGLRRDLDASVTREVQLAQQSNATAEILLAYAKRSRPCAKALDDWKRDRARRHAADVQKQMQAQKDGTAPPVPDFATAIEHAKALHTERNGEAPEMAVHADDEEDARLEETMP